MSTRTRLAIVLVAIAAGAIRPAAQSPQVGAAKIDQLIAQMTLDEKVSMLHGDSDPEKLGQAGYLPGVPRLGIPPMRLTDGPAGVRTGKPATALPAPVALASTFSPELARQYGQIIGRDGAALRQDIILAPMVNIVRVPQAGRNFETLGEDPFLASRLVEAEIKGIEGEGLIATVKHFALNNQENARQSVSADVDERTMHEIELQGFEAAVKAGSGSVMASYNKVNGTWASENALLQTDVLRTQWGFTGFVMSDWGATHSTVPALTSGLELEMPGGTNYTKIAAAVKSGELPEATVDRAVRRDSGPDGSDGLAERCAQAEGRRHDSFDVTRGSRHRHCRRGAAEERQERPAARRRRPRPARRDRPDGQGAAGRRRRQRARAADASWQRAR